MNITFQNLIDMFIAGKTSGVSGTRGNLKIVGDQLIHYDTVIAERYNKKIIVNETRYSRITGQIQKMLKQSISNESIIIVGGVPKNDRTSLVGRLAKEKIHRKFD